MSATDVPGLPKSGADRQSLGLVFAGLMLALLLAALDQNIVATALPRIVSDLGGLAHLSWVVTAFMVASTMTTPLYGKLSDIFGRKPAFFVSILIFLAGSVLCGLSRSMTELIVFRAVQGLGAGGLITLSQTVVGDLVSPRERGRYQGLFASVFAGCSVAGPLLGGFITDALSWHWIFYVNLPVGAAAMVMIGIGLKHRPDRVAHRIDYLGALLLSVATCCALLALSWGGNSYPWSSPMILGLGGVAAVASGCWCDRTASGGTAVAAAIVPQPGLRAERAGGRPGGDGPVRGGRLPAVVFPACARGEPDGGGADDLPDDGRRHRRLGRGRPAGVAYRALQVAGCRSACWQPP